MPLSSEELFFFQPFSSQIILFNVGKYLVNGRCSKYNLVCFFSTSKSVFRMLPKAEDYRTLNKNFTTFRNKQIFMLEFLRSWGKKG